MVEKEKKLKESIKKIETELSHYFNALLDNQFNEANKNEEKFNKLSDLIMQEIGNVKNAIKELQKHILGETEE